MFVYSKSTLFRLPVITHFLHFNMGTWFLILISTFLSLSISVLLKFIFRRLCFINKNPPHHKLPPGPQPFPIISSFLWLRMSSSNMLSNLKSLHAKLGPIVTIYFGTRPTIFIADRSLAHKALIQNGAIFSDRPPTSATTSIVSRIVGLSFYGPTWRLLRRNLTENMLNPSCVKSYSHSRWRVLQILKNRLESQAESGYPVVVRDHFQYAMFCLLCIMCYGDNVDEIQIKVIKEVQERTLCNSHKFDILNFWPTLTKILLRRRWKEFLQLHKNRQDASIPLRRARKKLREERTSKSSKSTKEYEHVVSYIDTLLALEFPDEKRKLNEDEIANLCHEFLIAGTRTTSTALEWIMANLVKYPQIQEKLFMEIKGVVGNGNEEIQEGDVQKMSYLKAVILEGLRRHPPEHFVVPHAVTKDVVLDEYLIPKNASINFMVAEMGLDPKVWEDPMAFKPDRILKIGSQELDITGSREIKMMPFGAGRRICPAYRLAMLHLEYFLANLIWKYKWKAVGGDDVDLAEKLGRAGVPMKNPLQVNISPRF
ncbi:unnamed protein product [Dovyalis caffra]|uniref:Cytochrome P450 n=1 Tax=Dovyalis caffra TaxID=77055 RepID=A0AAV1SWD2_9ROSI|nr:unnamed protein product [Dovyalis caffra]